jgi:uncharacterized membrane protein YjjP (DUF1212 family)
VFCALKSGCRYLPGPTLTFGFVLATLIASSFHLLVGGGARRLALFLLVGWLGFALGHIIGIVFEIDIFNIGALRLFPALVVTGLLLFFAHRISLSRSSHSR